MKKILLTMNVEGTDSYLTIGLEDCEDYYFINIEQRDCGVTQILKEQVIGTENLKELRNAIDYMISGRE